MTSKVGIRRAAHLLAIGGAAIVLALLLLLALAHGTSVRAVQAAQEVAAAGTVVDRDITTDTVWTQGIYTVSRYIRVQADATLTIRPGVEVRFERYAGMGVYGTIVAVGHPDARIVFTGVPDRRIPGGWNGMEIATPYGAEEPARADFQHVVMEYGGLANVNNGILYVSEGIVRVRNSTFRYGGNHGMAARLESTVEVADTHFDQNTDAALRLTAPAEKNPQLRNLTASGNGLNAVQFYAIQLEGEHTFAPTGLPYVMQGGLRVEQTGTLTITPGVEIRFDSGFYVNGGTLRAVGTAEAPVLLTGYTGAPGAWWGIDISGGYQKLANATFEHTVVEYAGGLGGDSLSITSAVVSVTHSVIRNGAGNGIGGGGGSPGDPNSLLIADTSITGNAGYALYFTDESANPVLRNLTIRANGGDVVAHRGGLVGDHFWENVGVPYLIPEWSASIDTNSSLTIEPGVEVRFGQNILLSVNGRLTAVGTPTNPITFTGAFTPGTRPSPGWWQGISVGTGAASAVLDHCDIGYGGANDVAMLAITSGAFVQNCRIHHSAAEGIELRGEGLPFIRSNRIELNAFGLRKPGPLPGPADARYNWWGHPSGPYHPEKNPDGLGNAVSDHVLFEPWLTDARPGERSGLLTVAVRGSETFAPGSTHAYAVFVANETDETVRDAVLAVSLPSTAQYVGNSGGGIVWPERRQVFWKLGAFPPGASRLVAVSVRYHWGIPHGTDDSIHANLGGTNVASEVLDVDDYLAYDDQVVVAEQPLSRSEVDTERRTSPSLDQLYTQATSEGFRYGTASRLTLNSGDPVTLITLVRFEPEFEVMYLRRQGDLALATIVNRGAYIVRSTLGAVQFNVLTGVWEDVPGTGGSAGLMSATSAFSDCMQQCIMEQVPGYIIEQVIKPVGAISTGASCVAAAAGADDTAIAECVGGLSDIPGVGEGIALGKCVSDCRDCKGDCDDPRCHCCKQDKLACDYDGFPYGWFGIDTIVRYKCDLNTGRYLAGARTETVCALCEKCVEGPGGPVCTQKSLAATFLSHPVDFVEVARALDARAQAVAAQSAEGLLEAPATATLGVASGVSSRQCLECQPAKDPNAKYGAEGDVVPGQLLTYTITVENVGAGVAYGVFVRDELSEHFDLGTLTRFGSGATITPSRTLFWFVGDLRPKGQPGSTTVVSFTVRLKPDLPSGTVIANEAVVHFPSVPEETATNAVVNVVQPLAALPQVLQTRAGEPVAIRLSGRDAAGSSLTYAIVERPVNGTISGRPPALTYTPGSNFTGQDLIRFTVSNGVTTSRPADIQIQVLPSPRDRTAPQVVWTKPASGEEVEAPAEPRFASPSGVLYAPALQVGFSEVLSSSTVTSDTVRLEEAGGRPVPIEVSYDGAPSQAMIFPREALQPATEYILVLTSGIQDQVGNRLAEYRLTFRTTGAAATSLKVYLPHIGR